METKKKTERKKVEFTKEEQVWLAEVNSWLQEMDLSILENDYWIGTCQDLIEIYNQKIKVLKEQNILYKRNVQRKLKLYKQKNTEKVFNAIWKSVWLMTKRS